MISIIQRFKNLWAWSVYHPSGNLPNNIGTKTFNIESSKMAEIIHMRNEEKIINEILNEK